jgi:hypothetical protein
MSFSLYEASVPLFKQLLGSLSANLDKGAAFAESKKVDPAVLMQQRLAIDMFPLIRQVQVATDQAKGCFARLAGVDIRTTRRPSRTPRRASPRPSPSSTRCRRTRSRRPPTRRSFSRSARRPPAASCAFPARIS